jgi:hypothetical protein
MSSRKLFTFLAVLATTVGLAAPVAQASPSAGANAPSIGAVVTAVVHAIFGGGQTSAPKGGEGTDTDQDKDTDSSDDSDHDSDVDKP